MANLSLGGVEITTAKQQSRRMSIFLWGPSGAGKTTLASTAPKPILWVNFDPDGTSSLQDSEDILVADFSTAKPNVVLKFKHENFNGLQSLLEDHPEIQTVVFDSVTSYSTLSLLQGVSEVRGATVEAPTLQGYGRRNSYTIQALQAVIRLTAKLNKHLVVIAHEDVPQKDELTGVMTVSILIGGKMHAEIPAKFSEVWYLQDTGKDRVVTIRSSRIRKPMKSRMFKTDGAEDFKWGYDVEEMQGDGIENWYNKWIENEGKKIALP